jgi:hypothetical protein
MVRSGDVGKQLMCLAVTTPDDRDTLSHDRKERIDMVSVCLWYIFNLFRVWSTCPARPCMIRIRLTYRPPSSKPLTYLRPCPSALTRFGVALFPSLCRQLEHQSKRD